MNTYAQCRLSRGSESQISWLPSKFATVGTLVDLDEPHPKDAKLKVRDKGWTVVEIFPGHRTEQDVSDRSRDYKNTRKASDV